MKNILSILAVLALFLVSATAFAEGPMKLPAGANPEAVSHNKEGIASWNKKDYKGALMHFNTASKIDGSSGEVHFNEAICYDKLGQHGVATATACECMLWCVALSLDEKKNTKPSISFL